MKELLATYSLNQIVIFIVLLAIAIKGLITFFDWAKDRLKKYFDKDEKIDGNKENIQKLIESQTKLTRMMEVLLESDKDDIKAWITEKHHFFCYQQKFIDDYSLDTIEKRFKHYQDEGGNSFVENLMNDIRNLPKVSNASINIKGKENK